MRTNMLGSTSRFSIIIKRLWRRCVCIEDNTYLKAIKQSFSNVKVSRLHPKLYFLNASIEIRRIILRKSNCVWYKISCCVYANCFESLGSKRSESFQLLEGNYNGCQLGSPRYSPQSFWIAFGDEQTLYVQIIG